MFKNIDVCEELETDWEYYMKANKRIIKAYWHGIELSNWHSGKIKPIRKGIYERMLPGYSHSIYNYFDGNKWFFGAAFVDIAMDAASNCGVHQIQKMYWRGLVK